MVDRRGFLTSATGAAAVLALGGSRWPLRALGTRSGPEVAIFKNAGCMCCNRWAAHLEAAGFTTRITEHADLDAFKDAQEVPDDLRSCHTGLVDGFVVEGHVPASDIERLLDERPEVRGIAVAGMPVGSPGMESGDRSQPYEVIAFGGPEGRRVFSEHTSA